MLDLGTIQYNVEADTTDLNSANAELDNLSQHANEAGQATDQLGKKISETGSKAETASRGIANSFEKINVSLRREIDLYGQTGRAAILRYDIERGALGALTTAQKANLIALAETADEMDRASTAATEMARKEILLTEAAQKFEQVIKQQASALNGQFASIEANLSRELALYGNVSRAATLRYDLERGALRGLNNEQKATLSAMAARLDAMDDANAAFVNGNNAVTGSMGRMRGMAQNVGWQLQDVVVQLQMGTNAAMVFSQQGSQLVGAWNPLAGAAIAIAGVLIGTLIPSLFDTGKAAEKMAENTKALIKELNNLSDTQQKVVNKGLVYSINDETKAYEAQGKIIDEQIQKIRVLNAENGKTRTVATGGIGGGGAGTMTYTIDNTKLLEDATRNLTAAQIEQVAIQRRITELQDPSGSAQKIKALNEEAELVGKVGLEYWNLKAAQEGLTGAAKIEYVALGLLKEQREADKKEAEDAAKAKEKAAKDAIQAAEKLEEVEKRRADSIKKMGDQLQREADLFGITSKAAQVEYDVLHGLISVVEGLTGAEGQRLLVQARRIDQMQDELDLAKSLDAEIDRRLAAEKKAADDISKAAEKQADDISKAITDGLMRGFESGKGLMENLKDTAENIFKTMVLKPTLEVVTKPLTEAINSAIGAATGAAGGKKGGGGAGGLGALGVGGIYAAVAVAVVAGVQVWNKKQEERFVKMTSEYKQANQGLSAVLGEGNKKSETISKSIESLNEVNGNVLDVNYDMLRTLLDIREGIAGVAAGFSKTLVGGADYKKMGIKTGKQGLGDVMPDLGNMITHADPLNNFMANIGRFATEFGGTINTKILNAVFSKKKSITDSGIAIIGTSLADILTGTTLQAMNYADVKTTKKLLGVSYSTKVKRKNEDLDGVLESQISDVFKNAGIAVREASKVFGINFDDFTDQLTIKSQDISLKGLTGEELTKEIEAFFGATLDSWAGTLLNGTNVLNDFQEVGESAFDTMLRLATQTNTFADYVDKLDLNLHATGINLVYATAQIAELSGGFDQLSSGLATYYDKFFSESDKFADATKSVTKYFNELGIAVPKTRAEFKNMVQGLDLATEAGQKQFSSLIAVSGAMDEYLDMQEKNNRAIQEQREEQEKLKKQLAENAYSGLERSVSAQKKIIDAQIDAANKALGVSRAVYDSLTNTLNGLTLDTERTQKATRRQADAELRRMLEQARGGKLPEIDKLNSALSVVSEPNEQLYSTFEEYATDLYRTADTIKQLQDVAGKQVTNEEKGLASLERQVAQYDEMLVWAKKQVDVMNGVDVGVMSINAALYAFAAAVGVSPQSQEQMLAALAAKGSTIPVDPASPQAMQAEAARVQAETVAAENKSYSEFMKNAMIAISVSTDKTYKVLDKWDTTGVAPEREEL